MRTISYWNWIADGKEYLNLIPRFIWKCSNGNISNGYVIDHIDNDKTNDKIENLQLLTHQQNCKKSAKNRDYSFVGNTIKNLKKCKSN